MSNEFHNPFHFVPVAKPSLDLMPRESLPKLNRRGHDHVTHDRYVAGTYSGRIVCRLKLQTPTVLGALRTQGSDERPAEVESYQVLSERGGRLDWEPAIPETSLRGMIGSIVETATNSAMRILADTPLSVRMGMGDALQTVGVVRVDDKGRRWLLPLAFPMLRQPSLDVPQDLRPFAGHMQLKFYLNGFTSQLSHTADCDGVYFIRAGFSTVHDNLVTASDPAARSGWVFGRRNPVATRSLITRQQWLDLPESQRRDYIPGLLRNLGRHSDEALQDLRKNEANRERVPGAVLPSGVKHRWFIPLKPEIYDPLKNTWLDQPGQWIDIEQAAVRFEGMARVRTLDDPKLPFEVRGSLRNNELNKLARERHRQPRPADEHAIKIRRGDLLCFGKDRTDVSISCIWRLPRGTVWEWFKQIDPNLLPMNPQREQITLAEQLFGFVEQTEKGQNRGNRAKALAGRVRFSAGRLVSPKPDGQYFEPPRIAQILGAPKPPSPLLYFGKKDRQPVKKSLLKRTATSDQFPLGRKFYVHHDPDLLDWTTVDEVDHLKQKARLRPLKPGLEFVFDVAFDNLSRHELALLAYALRPTEAFRHRLGMGKPLGLGTVEIQPLRLLLVDRLARYRSPPLFDGPRYGQVARCAAELERPLSLEHAADDVQGRYAAELAVTEAGDAPVWDELVQEARELLRRQAPDALAVLEQLGVPTTTAGIRVHYPRLPDALAPDIVAPDGTTRKNTETKLYQWHTWNESRSKPQHLSPLTADHPRPKPLSKDAPFRFFLYDSLPDDQRKQLLQLLESHYPNRYCLTADESAIQKALDAGEILVHLGVNQADNVQQKMVTTGFGPLAMLDRNGNPEQFSVVERFRRIYLAVLRTDAE